MGEAEDERKLPELQMDLTELEELRRRYVELIGFVPPRIQARTDLLARLDPELLSMQEAMRAHAMYPECFDTKTAQLMLFGMLLVQLSDPAHLHARSAYRRSEGTRLNSSHQIISYAVFCLKKKK